MIKINLLPQELRRSTGTPPVLLGIVFGGVGLITAMGFFYIYLWFNALMVKEEMDSLSKEVVLLNKEASVVDLLDADIRNFKALEHHIVEMKTNRRLWSLKLDQLVQLTPDEIWITELQLTGTQNRQGPAKKEGNGGYLELKCYALGANVEVMTDFRRALRGYRNQSQLWRGFLDPAIAPNDFSYGFSEISNPSWEVVTIEDFVRKKNIQFTIKLFLKESKLDMTS